MGFWRSDFKEGDIQCILKKCKEIRSVGKDGIVNFSVFHHHPLEAILASAIEFDVRTEALKTRILRKTLNSPDLPNDFTENDFRGVVWKMRAECQNQSPFWRVVFPIWNKPAFLAGMRRIDDATINFSPSVKTPKFKRIELARARQRTRPEFRRHFDDAKAAQLDQCSICVVRVMAHTHHEAYERAADLLYGTLGLINIAADSCKGGRMSGGPYPRPVSDVLVAPHVTAHSDNGALAFEGFWHENWPVTSLQPLSGNGIDALQESYEPLARAADRSPWSRKCRSAAARYFKAFSNPNLNESFMDGWRLMEHVAGPRDDSTEDKIKRVSNASGNRAWWRTFGKHLLIRRNMITHETPIGIQYQDQETLAFQMLGFIRPYLIEYIRNRYSLTDEKEFWELLEITDQPGVCEEEESSCRRRLRLLEMAKNRYR